MTHQCNQRGRGMGRLGVVAVERGTRVWSGLWCEGESRAREGVVKILRVVAAERATSIWSSLRCEGENRARERGGE